MHEKGSRESQTLVDDGSGKVQIWRIEDFDMVALEPSLHGQFFGGDSYVILYTYVLNGKENYIVYFWQGAVCHIASYYHLNNNYMIFNIWTIAIQSG